MIFKDRQEAGQRLSRELKNHNIINPYIIALPKGGIAVAYQVATELKSPLDLMIIRQRELSNNTTTDGITLLNTNLLDRTDIPLDQITNIQDLEQYKKTGVPNLTGKSVILIDEGMSIGSTAQKAVEYIRYFNPEDIIVAIPVCSPDALEAIEHSADKVICLYTPIYFNAVSQWYRDYHQLSDREAIMFLNSARQ